MNFFSCTLVLVLTCAFIHVFCLLLKRTTKPTYKLPPGPSPLPIIGNLLELGQKPHKSLAKLAKIYGPLMSLKLGQITTVVISSSTMAKQVLLTNDKFLSNRTVPQSVSVLNHDQYSLAFTPISPLWKELRKICNTQLLSHKSLDASQDVRRMKIRQLLSDIHQSSQIGEAIDIGTIVFKTTINLLSNTIFSVDLIQSNGAAGEFKDLATDITKLMLDPQGLKRRQTKNVTKVLDIFGDLINQRLEKRECTRVDTCKDMLDAMLNISKDNEFMDKNMIQHLSLDIFVAGTDTTTSTLEWAMTELINNPEAMRKAKKELEETIGCGVPLEESNISDLPYLHAIIKETLRKHPPVPFLLPRKAERDVEICGYTIP
ncbi:cytochrome P450 family protein, partial [Medicago truncatula]